MATMTDSHPPQTTDDQPAEDGLGRRTFLAAAGTAAAASMLTGTMSTDATQRTTTQKDGSYESFEIGKDRLVLGGQRIVGADGYPTIQAAWNDAVSGDVIFVHSSYDAQAAGENFPIRLDYEEKEVGLTGGHASGSVIDASHTSSDVIEVVGRGHKDYQNNPVVRDLTIKGGNVGLKVYGAPQSSYRDLLFHRTASHGVEVCEYTDSNGDTLGSYGIKFSNVQSWACGGNGFHLNAQAQPHGAKFYHCKATACGGIGYRLRGSNVMVLGSTSQLNYGWGIVARNSFNTVVQGSYIEGNARAGDHDVPTEIYLKNAHGFTVRDSYFHGINPRGAEHDFDWVQRGITAHDCEGVTASSCTVRRYGKGFLTLYGCTDAEIRASSHVIRQAGLFGGGNGIRTRSDGVILPQDLTAVDGAFDGDRGYHVGTDKEGPAVWRGGQWHLASTTTL